MKVLHILGELKFSGAEIMLKSGNSKFEKRSIETYILSTGNALGEYARELSGCNYSIAHIPFSKSITFIKEVFSFIRNNNFDVVHIHTERFFFFFIIIAKLAGVKRVVRTIHSTFVFSGWLKLRRRLMLKFGALLSCRYIAISKSVYENELQQNSIKTLLVNNWIDTNLFKFSDNKKEVNRKQELNLISIGACSHIKQHFCILELIYELKKSGYSTNYLHLGSGELEESEKEIAHNYNIGNLVHFLGNKTNVLPYLHQSDFFLMPSMHEGLGNACLEAMASGVISIVNDAPGLRDLVTNNVNGLVVDFRDTESVKSSLLELYRDQNQMHLLRDNARKKIINLYGLDNLNKQIDIYFEH